MPEGTNNSELDSTLDNKGMLNELNKAAADGMFHNINNSNLVGATKIKIDGMYNNSNDSTLKGIEDGTLDSTWDGTKDSPLNR